MKMLATSLLAAACLMLTGCFQIQGVHVLHYFGDSDTGSYRISMSRITYSAMNGDNSYSDMMKNLRAWSRPMTRFDDDSVHLEDVSGRASMEHFYDLEKCTPAPTGNLMDCHYLFEIPKEVGKLPGWSVDWDVVLQPRMRILSSNHQRTRWEDGAEHLMWYYDGNQVSEGRVEFTVRTPQVN
jgi:hypothetical protein